MTNLRAHYRCGQLAKRRNELRSVCRPGAGSQVVGQLVKNNEFAHRPPSRPAFRNGDYACASTIFVVSGRRGTSGAHGDRPDTGPVRCDTRQREHLIEIPGHRLHGGEPCFRRKRDRLTEEVNGARTVLGGTIEESADELLGRIDPRTLTVPGVHRGSRVRAPGNSGLDPSRACRPARSPARRAAEEYPAEALVARQVPRALDSVR